VGEAPGEQEEREGRVFVGRAGKLLNQTIAELGWDTSQMYFTNVVMWRPPNNRDPKTYEIEACGDRLLDELVRIRPRAIVALGGTAANALLPGERERGITKMRGVAREIELEDGLVIPMMPTLHPAGISRQPDNWPFLFEDLRKIEAILGGHPLVEEPCWDDYLIVDNQRMFDKLIDRLLEQKTPVSVDIETSMESFISDPDDPRGGEILCIGFSWRPGTAAVLDWQALIKGNESNRLDLKEALETISCSFQGGQYDVQWLWQRDIYPNWDFDTMLGHYAINEVQGSHGLKRQAVDRYWAPYYDDDLLVRVARFRRDKAKLERSQNGTVGRGKAKSSGVTSDSPRRAKHGSQPVQSGPGHKQGESAEDRKLGLEMPLEIWSDPEIRPMVMKYCGADVDYTARLTRDLPVEMEADGVYGLMEDLLLPAAKHFTWLEMEGMKVDVEYLHQMGARWKAEQDEISEKLYDLSDSRDRPLTDKGRPWFSAPVRLAHYLYEELRLRPMVTTKADGMISQREVMQQIQEIADLEIEGNEDFAEEADEYWRTASSAVFSKMKPTSTVTFMLLWLGFQHPFPRQMVPWRKLDKKLTTYYRGYVGLLRLGGRIHPRYRVSGARTGRISCTDPNIHGVARQAEIKRVFIADEGFEILYSDRSQAEIRMLAHLSGDETLKAACESTDIHFAIACDLFKMTPEQMRALSAEKQETIRRAAKTIAFGIIYGRMPNSLAPQLGCTIEEATQYREAFLSTMKQASSWINMQRAIGLRMREVESIYGRKRRFPFIVDRKHGSEIERQAVNTPIQGAVSDMTLEDNLRIRDALTERGIDVLPWPHIHDGFMIQVEKAKMPEAVEVAKDILAHPSFETKVHFAVEVKIGPNWADLHTVHKG